MLWFGAIIWQVHIDSRDTRIRFCRIHFTGTWQPLDYPIAPNITRTDPNKTVLNYNKTQPTKSKVYDYTDVLYYTYCSDMLVYINNPSSATL